MLVDKLIEGWTQEQRLVIYEGLSRWHIGAVELDRATATWALSLKHGRVLPRETVTISTPSYLTFAPKKLIILEPAYEVIEHEFITVEVKTQKTWWSTRVIEPKTSKTIEHKKIITIPRSIWCVQGMFIGQQCQFLTECDISGDAFGPDGVLALSKTCVLPGILITLNVKNTADVAMPFSAIVVGFKESGR